MKTRIFITDDHPLIRRGLIAMINAEPDMEVCGEAEDCATATSEIIRLKPEVAIVDVIPEPPIRRIWAVTLEAGTRSRATEAMIAVLEEVSATILADYAPASFAA